MGSMNKAILIGNLGQDPDFRTTTHGHSVCTLSVATNDRVKKGDDWEDEVEWHRVVCWGKLAERCRDYLAKGRQVAVEGRIKTRKWQDKEGKDRYTTEVNAFSVVFLSGEKGGGSRREQPPAPSNPPAGGTTGGNAPAGSGGGDDDFPF